MIIERRSLFDKRTNPLFGALFQLKKIFIESVMANSSANIVSKNGADLLVDSVPEHSNSDLAGSLKSEDIFKDANQTEQIIGCLLSFYDQN